MRQALFFLVLLLLYAPVFAQPAKTEKGKSSLKLAKEHLQYEEYEDAIPYIKQLLEADASNAYYNFWMGKVLFITYKRNQALPYLEKVDKINPSIDKEFHYYYALTLHYNLQFDRAIEQYKLDLERYEPAGADYAYINNRISQCLYAKKLMKKKEGDQVRIANMGEKINSEFSEHSPVISANDSILIYTARRPESMGAVPEAHIYDEDVFVSHKQDNVWNNGRNIGAPVNSKGHDATISLTADGKRLYIYRHKKGGGLYVTDFDTLGKKWKEPRAMDKPLNSKYYEACIVQSADSSKMFFSSDRPGGFGGKDLYMCNKTGKNQWSEPINLGPAINTPFDEDAPYFHPDNKTLYYSSEGPKSMGGFDIFVTELDTSANGGWLEPLNMGYPVNTPDHDIYFVLSASGKHGYYSSGKEGGYGEKDIYQLEFPYYPYPRRYFIVELVGLAQDANSLQNINATVKLLDSETGNQLDSMRIGTEEVGQYYFVLDQAHKYTLEVVADGYNPTSMEINAPKLMDEDIMMEKNFFLTKPDVAVEIKRDVPPPPIVYPEFQNIYFDFDKFNIRKDASEELDRIAEFLKKNPDINVNIYSHTDWYNTYQYNVNLSENRAKSTIAYLMKKGLAPSRLIIEHLSENRPLETNENDDGRQFNRRSEFKFTKNGEQIFTSVKLHKGVETIYVDHTQPKGLAGFDNPSGLEKVTVIKAPATSTQGTTSDLGQVAMNDSKLDVNSPKTPTGKLDINATADMPLTDPAPAELLSASVQLKNVYFDFDQANLRTASINELDKIVSLLKKDPSLRVEIFGHTDAMGSDLYNQKLSEKRSKAAFDYLINHNLSEAQVAMLGFSEYKPLDSNESDPGRQNNRRVEFRVWKSDKIVLQSQP